MDVFLLWSGTYEDRGIEGVYDSLAAAQTAGNHGHTPTWSTLNGEYWDCDWTLVHHAARVPITITLEQRRIPVIDGVATLPDGRTVRSDYREIVVPIPPPPEAMSDLREWAEGCDYEIQRLPLLSR